MDSELDQRDGLGSLKLLLEFAKAAKGWRMYLVLAVGQKLNPIAIMWPPEYTTLHTIGQVLAAIASLDDFSAPGEVCCGLPSDLEFAEEVHKKCKKIARTVSLHLGGQCLICVKSNLDQDCKCGLCMVGHKPGRICTRRDKELYKKDPVVPIF